MDNNEIELELWNHQNEMIVLGTLYSKPEETGFTYVDAIKNSDFHDPAMRFYHELFNDYIMTYSTDLTETKMNMFCSMNPTRMQGYKKYGMYKTIKDLIHFAVNSNEEMKQQVGILKKWSVLRGINKNGYDVSRLLAHPQFNSLSADDCANLIRGNLDKVCSRIITGIDDPLDFADDVSSVIDTYLETPEKGHQLVWDFLNKACAGIMPGDSMGVLAGSNMGKGRVMIWLAMHLVALNGIKVGFLANEMGFESMRNAGLAVIFNSPLIQKLHGNQLSIEEKRFKTGTYKDSNGDIIYRKTDSDGNFIETVEQFRQRLTVESAEYRGVKDAAKWFEEKKSLLMFKNMSADYSDASLQRTVRQMVLSRGTDVWFYDTLKHSSGSDMSKWSDFVQTTTKLCELNQTLKTSAAIMSAQMNNSVFQVKPEEINSSSIASASYIFHLFDQMLAMVHLRKDLYGDYVFRSKDRGGNVVDSDLDINENLTVISMLKNRRGGKSMYLLNTDLDRNIWIEKKNGILIPKLKTKKELAW